MLNGNETPGEQPKTDVKLYPLNVVEQDPITGQTKHVQKQVTLEQALAYAQKGVRFEQKMGAVNAEIETKAAKKAETLIAGKMAELDTYLAEIRKDVPSEPAPTEAQLQELRENPGALVAYIQKVTDARVAKAVGEIEKKQSDADAAEDEENERVAAYDKEIKRVLVDRPLVTRKFLVDALVARRIPLDQVELVADELNEELTANLDLSKLPEDKRKVIVEAHLKKTTPPAPPVSGGGEKPPERKKTIDDIEKEERRKHGW